jgi:hypothetical protein
MRWLRRILAAPADCPTKAEFAELQGRVTTLEAKIGISGIGVDKVITNRSTVMLRKGSHYIAGEAAARPSESVTLVPHPDIWVIESGS